MPGTQRFDGRGSLRGGFGREDVGLDDLLARGCGVDLCLGRACSIRPKSRFLVLDRLRAALPPLPPAPPADQAIAASERDVSAVEPVGRLREETLHPFAALGGADHVGAARLRACREARGAVERARVIARHRERCAEAM
jgi:hypothetical protein